jgi:hypothetical protein
LGQLVQRWRHLSDQRDLHPRRDRFRLHGRQFVQGHVRAAYSIECAGPSRFVRRVDITEERFDLDFEIVEGGCFACDVEQYGLVPRFEFVQRGG